MIVHVARLALAPVLYKQARRMHATTPVLPEPDGERQGVSGAGHGELKLLIAGDSSAVGVGARTQEEALTVPLARALATRMNAAVHWQLIGQTGLTSEEVLLKLRASEVRRADIALITVGANDITREVPLTRALLHRAQIADWLRAQAGVTRVIFTSVPEMERFPAIPQPLAWYAGLHARRNNLAQARWARRQRAVHHADLGGLTRPELMAEDGYHPAPPLYAMVADRLAGFIATIATAPAA